MLKAYKYRLYPNAAQSDRIAQSFGCARFLYNSLLAWWNGEYKSAKEESRPMGRLPLVTAFKKEHPFLNDVDSLVLMNARRDFESAIKNFFDSRKGKRKGRNVGFPRFKKKGVCRDTFKTNCVNDSIRLDGDRIKLPRLGWVRCVQHRPLEGRIISATVSRGRDGRHFVSVLTESEQSVSVKRTTDPSSVRVVGIDMSLPRFAVDSEGTDDDTKAKYVGQFRKNERKYARLGRKVSRKVNGSGNRDKARIRLARLASRIADRRRDFVCKQALHYARNFDVVVIEDLDMRSMARSLRLGKSVNDLGWGEFRNRLAWKCSEYGTELVVADKWFASSKTCHECGAKNAMLTLSDRSWVCPNCGSVIDRDKNAALNLRDWYHHNTAGTAGIHACGENGLCRDRASAMSRQVGSAKQEASPLRER